MSSRMLFIAVHISVLISCFGPEGFKSGSVGGLISLSRGSLGRVLSGVLSGVCRLYISRLILFSLPLAFRVIGRLGSLFSF